MLDEKGTLVPRDFLAIIVIVVGALGFLILGVGLSSIGNSTLVWLGTSIVALVGFIATVLSRWFG